PRSTMPLCGQSPGPGRQRSDERPVRRGPRLPAATQQSRPHQLAEYHRELPRFVAVLDAADLPTVTVAAALSWAQGPDVDPASTVAPRRMTIARGFARYMAGIDA